MSAEPKAQGPNTSAGNIPPMGGPPAASNPKPAAVQPGFVAVSRRDLLSVQALDENTKDPNRHYRWVRTTKKDDDGSFSVTEKKRLGYEIEITREGGVRTLVEPDSTADGSIRMGDLVLMSCPKALRQARENDTFLFNERRLGANSEQFRAKTQGQRGAKLIGDEGEQRE